MPSIRDTSRKPSPDSTREQFIADLAKGPISLRADHRFIDGVLVPELRVATSAGTTYWLTTDTAYDGLWLLVPSDTPDKPGCGFTRGEQVLHAREFSLARYKFVHRPDERPESPRRWPSESTVRCARLNAAKRAYIYRKMAKLGGR